VCDLETSRMGAPYIYDISRLRVKFMFYSCYDEAVLPEELQFIVGFGYRTLSKLNK